MEKNMSNKYSFSVQFKKHNLTLSFVVGYVEQGKGTATLYDELTKKFIFNDAVLSVAEGDKLIWYWWEAVNKKEELEKINQIGKERFIEILKDMFKKEGRS